MSLVGVRWMMKLIMKVVRGVVGVGTRQRLLLRIDLRG